jgi:integrase
LKQLPKVLSKKQMRELVDLFDNVKHRLVVKFLYSFGLRLQELVNLKREDINVVDGLVMVRRGKGGRDRISLFAKNLEKDLLVYYSQTKFVSSYIFEGRSGNKYSKKSVQKLLENAGKKLGVRITPHMLRHLVEAGVDIRYVHVAKKDLQGIRSPLDDF